MKKTQLQRRTLYFTTRSFEKSAQAILNFNDSGLSLLEMSHRSKDFVAVMEEARTIVLELLGLEGKVIKPSYLEV
jgi:phosphoserine aminotransferase